MTPVERCQHEIELIRQGRAHGPVPVCWLAALGELDWMVELHLLNPADAKAGNAKSQAGGNE